MNVVLDNAYICVRHKNPEAEIYESEEFIGTMMVKGENIILISPIDSISKTYKCPRILSK